MINIQRTTHKSLLKTNLVATVVISALSVISNSAVADKAESSIEMVTVTAQKQVPNIFKVPIAVGTIS